VEIKPIRTEADYAAALERADALMGAEYGSAEGDELDILATLLASYEQEHHAIEAPDPVEFIKNAMEFRGLDQNALAQVLNSRPRASEILNRKRPLTLTNIRKITAALGIPADPLVREYKLAV